MVNDMFQSSRICVAAMIQLSTGRIAPSANIDPNQAALTSFPHRFDWKDACFHLLAGTSSNTERLTLPVALSVV